MFEMWSKLFLLAVLVCVSHGKPKAYFGGGCGSSCVSPCSSNPCGSLQNIWPSLRTSNLASSSLTGAYNQLPSVSTNSLTFGGLPLTTLQTGNTANLQTQYDTSSLLQNAYSAGTTGFALPATQYGNNLLQSTYASGQTYNLPAQYDVSQLQSTFTPQTATSQYFTIPSQTVGNNALNFLSDRQTYAPNYQTVSQPSLYQNVDYSQLASYAQTALPSPTQTVLPSQFQTVLPAQTQSLTFNPSQFITYSPSTLSGATYDTTSTKAHLQQAGTSYAPSYTWSTVSGYNTPAVNPATHSQYTAAQIVGTPWAGTSSGSGSNLYAAVPPKPNPTENIALVQQTPSQATGCVQCPVQDNNSNFGRHGG